MLGRTATAGNETLRHLLLAPLLASLLAEAACTPTTYDPFHDPPDYVDRVIEDVTAMVEGMARAHEADRVVVRDPGYRSSQQPRRVD